MAGSDQEARKGQDNEVENKPGVGFFRDQHYNVPALAKRFGAHPSTVRKWFYRNGEPIPGVLLLTPEKPKRGKRIYRRISIPESIANEQYQLHVVKHQPKIIGPKKVYPQEVKKPKEVA
jgi:hypothetical protein